jgi:phosphoribosylformylglycinamidine synthase
LELKYEILCRSYRNTEKRSKRPQGAAVETVLKRTNIENNAEVKVGKYFTLSVSADNAKEAEGKINHICSEVLSNPILESYNIMRLEQR